MSSINFIERSEIPQSREVVHLLVSNSREEYERLGATAEERKEALREMTRETVNDLERSLNVKDLHWCAVIHRNTDNPHVHLALTRGRSPRRRSGRRGERGSTLVEAIIGLMMFTIAAVAAGQLFAVHVNPLVMAERQRKAAKQLESLLNDLTSRPSSNLADGGSFALDAQGNAIRNEDQSISYSCSPAYCDQVIAIPKASTTELDLARVDWGSNLPSGSTQVYVRAWAITTLDANRRLRQVTVAIFSSGGTQPLAIQRLTAVLR